MEDCIATSEIRAGGDDLCKQYQAVRGARTGQIRWRKQQMFSYSTRSGHSAVSWSLLGKLVFLASEAKMPQPALLTSEAFCCCMSASQHPEPDASALRMPPWGAGGCLKGKAGRQKDGRRTQGNSAEQSVSSHLLPHGRASVMDPSSFPRTGGAL